MFLLAFPSNYKEQIEYLNNIIRKQDFALNAGNLYLGQVGIW